MWETQQRCGNVNAVDALKLFTGTRAVIVTVYSSDDAAKAKDLAETIREKFPFVLKTFIISNDPLWFPESDDDSFFQVFSSIESLTEAFLTMVYGNDRVSPCRC
jgi:hypothetical protein